MDGRSVGKVSAHREVEAHEGIPGFEDSHRDGHVCLCAGMGLHVCPAGTVELLGTLDGDGLALVHHLASAVVALAGIALGVFVGHHAAHGLQDLVGNVVLRRNEFQAVLLTGALLADQVENLKIFFHMLFDVKLHGSTDIVGS